MNNWHPDNDGRILRTAYADEVLAAAERAVRIESLKDKLKKFAYAAIIYSGYGPHPGSVPYGAEKSEE